MTQEAVVSSPSLSIFHSAFRIVSSRCSQLLRLLLYKLVSLIDCSLVSYSKKRFVYVFVLQVRKLLNRTPLFKLELADKLTFRTEFYTISSLHTLNEQATKHWSQALC
jgi:hypothetical protein